MQILSSFWFIVAAVCILGLAVYAVILWRQVWQTKQQHQQQRAVQKEQLRKDLIILADSLLTEQMAWAEGCIRIKVILDHYDFELGLQPENKVLHTVFEATEHIPSHDAWRELSSADKKPYQKLLTELELQHKKESTEAVQTLLQHLKN